MSSPQRWLIPTLTTAGVIILAQLVTGSGLVRPDQFPSAIDTFSALGKALSGVDLWGSVGTTLAAWFLGFGVGGILAIIIGPLLAQNEFAYRSAGSIIEIFKSIPAIAILPLVILTLGSTLAMQVFLIAFGIFWPLITQVMYGVRSIDPTVHDTATALGISGVARFLKVVIPSASPFIMTGLRIASAQALILAVVAQMIGGASGIGRSILLAQNGGVTAYPTMYAYILVSGIVGLALTGTIFLIEKRVMHWHESQRNMRSNSEVNAR